MKLTVLILIFLLVQSSFAQEKPFKQIELGVHSNFGASKTGFAVGGAIHGSFEIKDYLYLGPTLRYDNVTNKNSFIGDNRNSLGGGLFNQLRFAKVLCIEVTTEVIFPLGNEYYDDEGEPQDRIKLNATIGGGFNFGIKNKVRICGMVTYGLFEKQNYFAVSHPLYKGGDSETLVRINYRLGLYIPLKSKKVTE